jgi:hypothetical protein
MRYYFSNVIEKNKKEEKPTLNLGIPSLLATPLVEIFSYLLFHLKGRGVLSLRVRGIVAQIPM